MLVRRPHPWWDRSPSSDGCEILRQRLCTVVHNTPTSCSLLAVMGCRRRYTIHFPTGRRRVLLRPHIIKRWRSMKSRLSVSLPGSMTQKSSLPCASQLFSMLRLLQALLSIHLDHCIFGGATHTSRTTPAHS